MGLGFKLKRKNICHIQKSQDRQLNAWRMEITTYTGNFFTQSNIFLKWIPAPENCKNQEINRIKSKFILKCNVLKGAETHANSRQYMPQAAVSESRGAQACKIHLVMKGSTRPSSILTL